MRTSDKIIAPSRGTAAQAISHVDRPEQMDRDYIAEVYAAAPTYGVDAAICLSQWHVETDGGTSWRWRINGNPAGLLVSADDDPDPATWTGVEAAHVHIWALAHACDPTTVPDWEFLPQSAGYFVERWTAKYHDPTCPAVVTIDDLNIRYTDAHGEPQATWAWDAEYQDLIVQRSRVLFGDTLPDQTGGEPTVPSTMPTIPVHWLPVPVGAKNNPSGLLSPGDLIVVWHENGNPNSDADAEGRFVLNGGGESNVSYHFAVDHEKAYQMFALNELCYHAADGCNNRATDRGCFRGVAIEHCQDRDPGRWAATKRNGAILTAMIIAGDPAIHFGGRAGSFSADRIETHQAVSETNKHCPDWMLNENAIPSQVGRVRGFLAMGETTTTTTTTAAPHSFPTKRIPAPDYIEAQSYELTVNDPKRFKATQGQTIRTAPNKDAPAGTKTPIKAGRVYTFDFSTKVDGEGWLLSKSGSWVLAKGFEAA
jgi:N-acetylmuramoyl-L-alanine amidase CwlA